MSSQQPAIAGHKALGRARSFGVALALALFSGPVHLAFGQATPDLSLTPIEEKEACIKNLRAIYQAIQNFQSDNHDLPNWLSDLVPKYISDTNLLICPVCRRTGRSEGPPLADPHITSSYLFEFCPVPMGGSAPNDPTRTRREWKRRQMGIVGSVVPIVRCRHHDPLLNLSFDGRLYESPSLWETVLSNRVNPAELTPAAMFSGPAAESAKSGTTKQRHFAPRDPKAGAELIDLTEFYNAMLTEAWHGNAGNDLAALPTGLQILGGVQFDIRGIVQLGSKSPSNKFPPRVPAIKVSQKCQSIHFLHAAGFGSVGDEGKQIGSYAVRYAGNRMVLEIPIVYGREVRNWHTLAGEPAAPKELAVVWSGENAVSRRGGSSLRLFLTTWTNLAPDVEIESLDYVSAMGVAAPFLIAITASPQAGPPLPSAPARANGENIPGSTGVPGGQVSSRSGPGEAGASSHSTSPVATGTKQLPQAEPGRIGWYWWLAGSAGSCVLAALLAVAILRSRKSVLRISAAAGQNLKSLPDASAPSYTVTLASAQPEAILPSGGSQADSLAETDDPGVWRQRALVAQQREQQASMLLQSGVLPYLSRWLKQKLLRKLIADRATLIQTQETAALKALDVEERLTRVEVQIQEQNAAYQQRIEQLTRELLVAKEENRGLIQAQITQIKLEMEAARTRLLARGEDGVME